ncbi:MAG: S9 family peptidase, partial [Chitinophagaceae bacterium]|nr:S9 family peptidase [Chitinophagaceae bacterium]
PLALNDYLLLSVLDDSTKHNGFAKVKLSKANALEIRSSGPYLYNIPIMSPRPIWPPKKARKAKVYVLQRQSCVEEPNVFVTSDFNVLLRISDINSHKDYKWHSSQLLRWSTDDKNTLQGILFVPDELDSSRKYPIIFNYYEQRSHEIFQFNDPSFLSVNLNIAWYLNRGYVVCVPDIIPCRGATGPSALNSVVSVANMLTNKYKWIDKNRMGLQGHSHGGYITNFIATHCDLFAAAQSGAGYSDFFSGYGQFGFGASLQWMQEIGQNNLGTTPWKNPQVYIDNSCIFSADKVKTPLLILQNEGDDVVRFPQGLELFLALRREEKPVWMLNYNNEGHSVWKPDNVTDFLIRQQQFFDHYLKGKPAPLWMVEGIPLKFKAIKS